MTILWSLAQLHHQPDQEWMSIFFEASEHHLSRMTGSQLAQMGYGLGQLGMQPPAGWMEAFLNQVRGGLGRGHVTITAGCVAFGAHVLKCQCSAETVAPFCAAGSTSALSLSHVPQLKPVVWLSVANAIHTPTPCCCCRLCRLPSAVPVTVLGAFGFVQCHWWCHQCQLSMGADDMGGRDAACLLASLATLQHTPR